MSILTSWRTGWTPDHVRGDVRAGAAILLSLALAACGSGTPTSAEVEAAADADKIACQVGGAADFERVCAVERASGEQGLELTIRHPDGGFRRFLVTRDGRGVVAADGAEQAQVTPGEGEIEVALGGDRYRLPATVRGQ